jgi:SAM-dependent methyltransferase
MSKIRMHLPPEGALEPNDEKDDPLPYYYSPIAGRLYRGRIESGLSLLQPHYESILEVGYGSGINMPTLSQIGGEVWGVDICSDPERVADRLTRIGVRAMLAKADICDWDCAPERFDLVVAFSVFEHIPDSSAALRQIWRLLKPKGMLLVGMPRVDKLMTTFFSLIGYSGIEDHHVNTFRKVCDSARPYFDIECTRVFPRWCPRWAGLYFSFLFKKRDADGSSSPGMAGRARSM